MTINVTITSPLGSPALKADFLRYLSNLEDGTPGDFPAVATDPSQYILNNVTDVVLGDRLQFRFLSAGSDLQYNGPGGVPTGGMVTSVEVWSGDRVGTTGTLVNLELRVTITGLNWDAADLYQAIDTGDIQLAEQIIYGQDSFNYVGDVGPDAFTGGTNDDTLNGKAGDDNLFGDGGDDTFIGGAGKDKIDGGADGANGDTVDYSGILNITHAVKIALGAANVAAKNTSVAGSDAAGDVIKNVENILGGDGNDELTGNFAANTFKGSSGNDKLTGGAGDDQLYGEEGDDILEGGPGADFFDGGDDGASGDTVTYANSVALGGVSVNLLANSYGNAGALASDAAGDTAQAGTIENITGSKKDDILIGDAGANKILGGTGADSIEGGDGADILDGGALAEFNALSYAGDTAGVDVKLNGAANATIGAGGIGNHALGDQAKNFLNLIGGSGNDTLTGDSGANVIQGGAGADDMDGGLGIDTLSYAGSVSDVNVVLDGAASGGDAAGDTNTGFENLAGSAQNDVLEGNTLANVIKGGDGKDLIRGHGADDTLLGEAGDDEIFGGAGKDTMDGGADFDILHYDGLAENITLTLGSKQTAVTSNTKGAESAGDKIANFEQVVTGSGNDSITGSSGDDVIYAGDGNDLVQGGGGADNLNGEDGIDTASYASSKNGVTIDLANETGDGGDAAGDSVSGFENVIGSALNDTLTGDANTNTLDGGAGDDVLAGGAGADQVIGGTNSATGGDTADYSAFVLGVNINLLQQATKFDAKTGLLSGGVAQTGGDAAGDKLFGIENVIGSSGADTITGDAKNNVIEGGADGDTLDGGAGIDTLSYASSNVGVNVELKDGVNVAAIVSGGHAGGDDAKNFENVLGSDEADTLTGNAAVNVLSGGDENDVLSGLGGTDTLIGGDGNDMLAGGALADKLAGGDGTDTADYSTSAIAVTIDLTKQGIFDPVKNLITKAGAQVGGDAAGDFLSSIENVIGSAFNDVFISNGDANAFDGGSGGKDTVSYANSAAAVTASLAAPAGNTGDATDDTYVSIENLTGTKLGDNLTGDANANTLDGGAGDDRLSGGAGADQLIGGTQGTKVGDSGDTANYENSAAAVTVNLSEQATKFDAKTGLLSDGLAQTGGDAAGDKLFGVENVQGSDFGDVITGDKALNIINGNDGNDKLSGGDGNDRLFGGNDDDLLDGGNGDDTIDGGADNDTVSYASSTKGVTVNLVLNGGSQNTGGSGKDYINDVENVIGSALADKLTGDNFDNVITGGKGLDTLEGGVGVDTYVINSGDSVGGFDIINNFQDGSDIIDLSSFNNLGFGDFTIEQDTVKTADTLIIIDSGTKIRLTNFDKNNLSTADFKFSNAAPDDITLTPDNIDENEAGGSLIGTLSATDAEDVSGFTFTLIDDADGRFEVKNGNELYAVNLLDAEDATGIQITVQVTDSGGAKYQENLTVNVNDLDEFDATPVTDTDAASDTVNENASKGTLVGIDASSDDADIGDDITYSLTDDADGAFQINSSTGVVTVLDGSKIDREADASLDIAVKATSTDGSFTTKTFTVTVNDVDEFDAINVGDIDAAANAVNENAANGSTVGVTAFTQDFDATNNVVTYTLTDNANGAFQIDANTGEVTVADGSKIDREASSSLNITFKATSEDGSSSTKTVAITINDVDESDATTPVDTNGTADAVDENAANGTAVGVTAFSEDEDATNSTITYSLTDDAGGAFEIDANSGVVTVADGSKIDREADASLDITVKATSADGSSASKIFTIAVNDIDESDPAITSNGGGASASINVNENSIAVTTVAVADSDATASFSYELSGVDAALFDIDSVGVLTFAGAPDFEDPQDAGLDGIYNVTVKATSGSKSDSQDLTITIDDVEEAPEFTSSASFTIGENISEVGTAAAFDPDGTGTVTYALNGGADVAKFSIDTNTGVLSFVNAADFENPDDTGTNNQYEVIVKASDGTSNKSQTITVAVTDVNEAPTQIAIDNAFVDEFAVVGTVVGVLSAADQDAADQDASDFTYTLVDDADGRFALDGDKIVVNGDIDFETNLDGIEIQVQAKDSAGNLFGQTITINVNDLAEVTAPDGYIAGATIFDDKDFDFEHDFNETSVTSDALGNFNFSSGSNPIVLIGGTDIATGKAFSGFMAAPSGATVVSPLTTLVQVLNAHAGFNYPTEADANTAALNALGLNAGIGLLSQYDQIAKTIEGDANGPAAAKEATRLQEMLAMVAPIFLTFGASQTDSYRYTLLMMTLDISTAVPITYSASQIEGWIEFISITELGSPAGYEEVAEGAGLIISEILAKMGALGTTGTALLEDLAEIALVASNAATALAGANAGNIDDIVADYTGAALDALIAGETGNSQDVQGVSGDNTLNGTAGADFLDGAAGNDTLNGGDGNDVLVGGFGNDELNGGAGKDVLSGGDGDDDIDGGAWYTANDNAGSGDLDRVAYSNATSGVTVDLSIKGIEQDTGGGGKDTIIHVEGIIGSSFKDTLKGGGNEFIESFLGGGDDDIIMGNGGNDRAEYADATGGVEIDMGAGTVKGIGGDNGIGEDTLTSIEEISGSSFDDIYDASGFTGSTAAVPSANSGDWSGTYNSFLGGAGDDTIIGNGDTRLDYLTASKGVTVDLTNRDVDANTGKVYAGNAGAGVDTFSGVNRVRGSMFDDTLIGGQQEFGAPGKAEFFMGLGGNDFINGGSGFDYAQYQVASFFLDGVIATDNVNSTDINEAGMTFGIIVNLAAGTVTGDAKSFGTDTLREVEGLFGSVIDDLYDATGFGGTSVNKSSVGIASVNEFEGGAGNDIIIGNGATRVSYRGATEGVTVTLVSDGAGSGKGTVSGGVSVGTDTLVKGIASVRGSDFDDTITGFDTTTGFQIFDGQGGHDTIDGKGGFDRVTYNQDNEVTQGITVNLTATGTVGSGGTLTGAVSGNATEVGNDVLLNIESVVGTNFDDVLKVTNGGAASGFGTFELEGAGGNDTLNGLFATSTFTRLSYSGATDDVTVTFNNSGTGTTNTGSANGNSSVGSDTFSNIRDVRGGNYDDVITGRTTYATVGNIDNSQFQGGAGGNDIIQAGTGNDLIWGGDNDNTNGTERLDGYTAAGFDDIDYASFADATGAGVVVNMFVANGSIPGSNQTGDYGTAGASPGGNSGTDTLANIEGIIGSVFNDTFNGAGYFFEYYRGGAGDDAIFGGGGIDFAEYTDAVGAGISVNLAGGSVEGTAAGLGDDTLTGVEYIVGTAFADTFNAAGFSGSSTNAGSKGALNFFRGGDGNDVIIGNGSTRLDYSDATAGFVIDITNRDGGGDVGYIYGAVAGVGDDEFSFVNSVRGSAFGDTIIGGQGAYDNNAALLGKIETFIGGGGNDSIDGGIGFDRAMYHLDGNIATGIKVFLANGIVVGDEDLTGTDTLLSIEAVTGSVLADIYDARGFGFGSTNAGSLGNINEFEGHAGNDTIIGNNNTRIAFYNAQEAVSVDLAAGTSVGGASTGTDTFSFVNRVRGSDFNDTILGNAGANILEGQLGNDRIEGRGGSDTLTGGDGNDTFVFGASGFGVDSITDFVEGASVADVIEFSMSVFADYSSVQAAMTQVGADVLITAGSDSITIRNATIAGMNMNDFTFV